MHRQVLLVEHVIGLKAVDVVEELVGVADRHRARAPNGDGLELLASHSAPWPPRPALWWRSVEKATNAISFSPAGPIESVFAWGSKSRRIACSISEVRIPQYLPSAGTKETASSLTVTTTGFGDSPVTMMAS